MKIKIDTDDELPLNKLENFPAMTVIIRSTFEEDDKYYSQLFRRMFTWVIKIVQYKKIDVSEGIDTNKTSASKECMFCHFWHFKSIGHKFESNVCNVIKVMMY